MQMKNDNFNNYKYKLEKWFDKNIYFYAGDLVDTLIKKNIIAYEDIINLFVYPKQEDFKTLKDYNEAMDNPELQQVCQWFAISEEAYNKFQRIGDPVIKFEELHIWGRLAYGQAVEMDYYNNINDLKILLDIN